MDSFHTRLARVGLAAAERYGFALAGGYAVQAAGLLERPDGLRVQLDRRYDTFARLNVSDTEHASKVELGVDWRANEPIRLAIGSVLHPDDAVANKMSALYGRALARDFIDIDAALRSGRYDQTRLLALIERADAGFDRRMFADALGQAQVLDDDDFAQYGLTGQALTSLRVRFAAWRSALRDETT